MWQWRRSRDGQTEGPVGADEMLVTAPEPIVGLDLEQAYELGRRAGEVRAKAADSEAATDGEDAEDPGVVHVEAQGEQSVLLTVGERTAEVDRAVADERKAQMSKQAASHHLHDAVEAQVRAEQAVGVQQERAEQYNGSLLEDAPSWLLFVVIGGIAIAEWVLNRAPFNLAGDDQLGTDLLAATVGIGLVAAAHLGGVGLKRTLVPVNGARRAALHHQVMVGVLFALVLAVVAIGGMRAAFFAQEGIEVSWAWMMIVQAFLLSVATLLSMAHDAPMRAELSRLEEIRDDANDEVTGALAAYEAACEALDDAAARSRTVRTRAICEVGVQDVHTTRAWAEYAAGLQEAMGRPVGCTRPASLPMPQVAAWKEGLFGGDDSAATDVAELIRSWRAQATAALGPVSIDDADTLPQEQEADDEDDHLVDLDAATATSGSSPWLDDEPSSTPSRNGERALVPAEGEESE